MLDHNGKENVSFLKKCLYNSLFPLRVLTYQPTVRMPNVQALDPSYLTSSLADYAVPFHPSTLASIPADMQSKLAVLSNPMHH